ncbi:MAG: hypothetical protein H7A19_05750 [Rhodanobacteraceae bacterium]|nr:hypothetical protein [Xanthomonadales bacterium]MCP5474327.1 hypothetical protein [Rhodanobacteraceae bacterium]
MKYRPHDIVLHVRLACDEGTESLNFRDALDLIENVLYNSDRRDIEQASQSLRIPPIIADAAKERIRNLRHERLRITNVSTGSIVLEGTIAAAALFVLKKTIMDPFGDAYRKSRLYGELSNFFRQIIDEKTLFISEKLREMSHKNGYVPEVRHEIKSPDIPRHIFIELRRDDETKRRRIPSLGEELDKNP